MPQLTPQELDQIRNSLATATDEVVIATIKAVLSGGIDKVHPDLLRIIADEINARGIASQMMGERRTMKSVNKLRNTIRSILVETKEQQDASKILKIVDKYLKSSLSGGLTLKSSNAEYTDEGLKIDLILAHGKLDFKGMKAKKIEQGKRGAYSTAPSSKTQAVRQLTDHPKANINPNDQSTSLKMLQSIGYEALEGAKKKIESHLDCEMVANLYDVKRTGKGESHWEVYLYPKDESGFKLKADHNLYTTSPSGQRIGLGQGNVGIVADECDFASQPYGTVKKMWDELHSIMWGQLTYSRNRFSIANHSCGDYIRFIHHAITITDKATGEHAVCIFFRDRANAYNATKRGFDVYVLNNEQLKAGLSGDATREPSSWWSNFAPKGTLVFNTSEVYEEVEEALTKYNDTMVNWKGTGR